MTPKSSRIATRSLLGAVIVLFLMPFTTLTCGGAKLITMNGVQLATGATISSQDPVSGRVKNEKIKPEPLAAIAAISTIIALGLAFVGGKVGKISTPVLSGLSALMLLLMKFKVDQNVITQGQEMIAIQWEFGFWLALLASIAVTVISCIPNKIRSNESA